VSIKEQKPKQASSHGSCPEREAGAEKRTASTKNIMKELILLERGVTLLCALRKPVPASQEIHRVRGVLQRFTQRLTHMREYKAERNGEST